jgi:hypothetical protein
MLLVNHWYPFAADAVRVTKFPAQIVLPEEVIVGVIGVAGCASTVTGVATLIQPAAVFAVRLYVPAATPVKIPVVLL